MIYLNGYCAQTSWPPEFSGGFLVHGKTMPDGTPAVRPEVPGRYIFMYGKMIAVTNHSLCRGREIEKGENGRESRTEIPAFMPGTDTWIRYLAQIRRIVSARPRAIVLREKDLSSELYKCLAYQVREICRGAGQELIVNTAPDIAHELGTVRIHIPMSVLRSTGRPSWAEWTGTSIHSVEEVKEAIELGADSLFAGNIYETDCKKGLPGRGLEFLRQVCNESTVPVYAIGGVNENRLPQILETGAAGGCMMSGFMRM